MGTFETAVLWFMRFCWAIAIAAALLLVFGIIYSHASAHEWYGPLRTVDPHHNSCCNQKDCVPVTKTKWEDGREWLWIEALEIWWPAPDQTQAMAQDPDGTWRPVYSPDGLWHACTTTWEDFPRCIVAPGFGA